MSAHGQIRTWTLSPHVYADLTSEGGVLLDTAGGQCHALNSMGAHICDLLSGPQALTSEEILATLTVPEGVTRDAFVHDVHRFLEQLRSKRLLRKGPKRPAAASNTPAAQRWTPLWNILKLPPPAVSAYLLLVLHDVAIKTVGLRAVPRLMPSLEPGRAASQQENRADAIVQSVDRAVSFYYKHTWCLHRASVTCALLRIYGFAATVSIGFHRMPFYGHAWVEMDGVPINEKRPLHDYRVVSRI